MTDNDLIMRSDADLDRAFHELTHTEAFLQHEANLKAWADQMKALKTELAEAEADGDQDAVEYVMRRYECWFFQRPMQKGE